MAWKWNPFTRNLDYYEANTGGGGGDPATTVVITHVANYSAYLTLQPWGYMTYI